MQASATRPIVGRSSNLLLPAAYNSMTSNLTNELFSKSFEVSMHESNICSSDRVAQLLISIIVGEYELLGQDDPAS
jgi:hypothetical protein